MNYTIRILQLSLIIAICLGLASCVDKKQSLSIPVKSASSQKGMVVSAHQLASETGLNILKKGGNAAEAAIAVQLALAVVYPRAGNIGGGGFLVYRDQAGEVTTLDFRERAPQAASRDMYLDSLKNVVPNLSTTGVLAAGVPGTVAGLAETYKKFGGVISWEELIEPAIQLAEKGFPLSKTEADRLNEYQEEFFAVNEINFPFLSDTPWQEGDILVQKELAATLRLIAQNGSDGFYSGSNADVLAAFMEEKNGILTKEDLLDYKAVWRKPFVNTWRGYKIYSMGLPSSGGIVMGQILRMIDPLLIDSLGFRDPGNLHLIVEAERRAYADRAKYLGDADYYPVDTDTLLTENYLSKKMSSFDPSLATQSQSLVEGNEVMVKEHYETTHLSITDQFGNAASVTTTLNDNFGCKVWVPKGGYFLNNEMDDFSAKPGVQNTYGLIGGEANAIIPGKRMLSSMTPSILEKEGKLFMVLGTPGGSTIITSVLQVILNVTSFNMNIDEAVEAPRYHHQWLPDLIMYEKDGIDSNTINLLEAKGHILSPVTSIGLIEAILVDQSGTAHGSADHRSR